LREPDQWRAGAGSESARSRGAGSGPMRRRLRERGCRRVRSVEFDRIRVTWIDHVRVTERCGRLGHLGRFSRHAGCGADGHAEADRRRRLRPSLSGDGYAGDPIEVRADTVSHFRVRFDVHGSARQLRERRSDSGEFVQVSGAKTSGDSAAISGMNVHVDGTTLTALMIAHATGVKPGQFDISFQLQRVGGAWYVTDMNMNLG
jgi:hypothetical protein